MTIHFPKTEEDKGYRRGFDQGFAALAYALGIKNSTLQELAWKKRCKDFRFYRLKEAPCFPTDEEIDELFRALEINS